MSDRTGMSRRLMTLAMATAMIGLLGVGNAHATHNKPKTTTSTSTGSTKTGSTGTSTTGSTTSSKTTSTSSSKEVLVYDWNKPVTKGEKGFPRSFPPKGNGNWKSPTDFANGTYHYRVQIKKQPKAQDMKLQYCVWQDNFTRENCGKQVKLKGSPGTVVTWSQPVTGMWRKNGSTIDYGRARQADGFAIWNNKGPVSDYAGMKWSGANPSDWYPLDVRMTVVVVAKGATFSGWDKYTK